MRKGSFTHRMKSPETLITKLTRQWHDPEIRAQRLLSREPWPLQLAIGKPNPRALTDTLEQVRTHVHAWRTITVGRVHWENIVYRSASDAVAIPLYWIIDKPSEWIAAIRDDNIASEFQSLAKIVAGTHPEFHALLVRQYASIKEKPIDDVIRACELARQLTPGCACGAPLRAMSFQGIDSKFFERHRSLLTKLLDLRFAGLASELGLEGFLDAASENDHWLLVADLDGRFLPFKYIRVSDRDLLSTALPATQILIVENERCLHQLPALNDTIAILGAGLNLSWMKSAWLSEKKIAYWGDIDTWGLTMLARAREHQPSLTALLMTSEVFYPFHGKNAVPEPKPADTQTPATLSTAEQALYLQLLQEKNGRLEQEFLPKNLVAETLVKWSAS